MPKPILPPWATDGTNNTEPSALQKASGWTPGQDGVSDYDNWWKEKAYRWFEYLNVVIGDDESFQSPRFYNTEEEIFLIDPTAALADTQAVVTFTNAGYAWDLLTTTRKIWYPLHVKVGQRIKSWSISVYKGSGAGPTISAGLEKLTHAAETQTGIGALQTNNAGPFSVITLGQSGLDEPVIAGTSYRIALTGSGTTGDKAYGAQFSAAYPRP